MNDTVSPTSKPKAPPKVVKQVRKMESLIREYKAERDALMIQYQRTHGPEGSWSEYAEAYTLRDFDQRIEALEKKVQAQMEEYNIIDYDFGKGSGVEPMSLKQTRKKLDKLVAKRNKLADEHDNATGLPDEIYAKRDKLKQQVEEMDVEINELRAIVANTEFKDLSKMKHTADFDTPDNIKASVVITYDDLRASNFDFQTTLDGSIKNWEQDISISLNAVLGKLNLDSDTDNEVPDVAGGLGLMKKLLSKLKVGGVVAGAVSMAATNSMVSIIEAGLGKYLSNNPTALLDVVAGIEEEWKNGAASYSKANHKAELIEFLEDYQKKYPLRDADDQHVWLKDFHNACSKYSDNNLPTKAQVTKIFVDEIVAATAKTHGKSVTGELDINITWRGSEGMDQFLSVETSITSATKADQLALMKRNYKGQPVTDLAGDIKIKVVTLANGNEIFRAYRPLGDAKEEDFKMVKGGHQKTFDLFLKKKPWRNVMVADL